MERRQSAASAEELEYYRAHFREALREDGAVCLGCGRVCISLGNHVQVHGLTAADYRERWGYNRGPGLVSLESHERRRKVVIARDLVRFAPPDALEKAQRASVGLGVPEIAARVGPQHVGVNRRLQKRRGHGLLPEPIAAPAQGLRDEG